MVKPQDLKKLKMKDKEHDEGKFRAKCPLFENSGGMRTDLAQPVSTVGYSRRGVSRFAQRAFTVRGVLVTPKEYLIPATPRTVGRCERIRKAKYFRYAG